MTIDNMDGLALIAIEKINSAKTPSVGDIL